MKKGMKTAGIVALSAILSCGALGALAGCGGGSSGGNGTPTGDKDTLTVSIFCNAQDATTNQKICNEWAAEYSAAHADELGGKQIKVDLTNNPDKGKYFEQLNKEWSTGSTADIIYLAPKYVKSYVENGNILELSQYLSGNEYKNEKGSLASQVWSNSISYYGYIKGQITGYKMGQPIKEVDGKFFTAADNKEVGLYGLPKDYSNFSTGYNRRFFSDELKQAYQTTKPTQGGNVSAPTGEGSGQLTSGIGQYEHNNNDKCIVYAAEGHNDVANENFSPNQVANIINVGIPTTYYPYNFFRFKNYQAALNGLDPVALMSDAFGGYTVTIPGFPNDALEIGEEVFNEVYKDLTTGFNAIDVPYNKTIGHVTYTYAEYGALLWAVTYYLNTYNWENNSGNYGGVTGVDANNNETHQTIYGGEQYEGIAGATGSVLYLLPWLASNDADLINDLSTVTAKKIDNKAISDPTQWKSVASSDTYAALKRTLDDNEVSKNVQYGHNSQNFIETYAAFLAIGSDWNVNPCGDTDSTDRAKNGWAYFREGRSICYGAGSWDAGTRNDTDMDILDFGQMPTPIAEKYALYSEVKDANYQRQVYSNDPAKAAPGSADEAKQRAPLSAGKVQYSEREILRNQVRRQDKWAARMDTVGYAVAAKVADYPEEHAWKEKAAVSLTARLTLNENAQKTLLYAGAQLPNFVDQCKQFVDYKSAGADGWFSDMLTPEGFYNSSAADGAQLWKDYYAVARAMNEEAKKETEQTVAQFLADKKDSFNNPIKYDSAYAETKFKDFAKGETTSRLAYAMKVLKMVTFRADDRDINIRMQYGLNSVRDSSMYTYRDNWLGEIDSRTSVNMLAYLTKTPYKQSESDKAYSLLVPDNGKFKSSYILMDASKNPNEWDYYTPAVWCLLKAEAAQEYLNKSISDELATLLKK